MGIDDEPAPGRAPSPWIWAGAIAIAAGFALTIEDVRVTWSDGAAIVHYRNWVALIGGAIALVAAAVALVTRRRPVTSALLALAVAVGGAYQVARGLGLFYSPGPPPAEAAPAAHAANERAAVPTDAPRADAPEDGRGEIIARARRDCEHDQPARCADWRAALATACDQHDADRCRLLGAAFLLGRNGPADEPRGRALSQTACDLGSPGGCGNLAFAALRGKGGAVDVALARRAGRKGCAGDAVNACQQLFKALAEPPVPTAAEALGDQVVACFHGSVIDACTAASDTLIDKPRTPDDDILMSELFGQACRVDGATSCKNFAHAIETGLGGVPPDPARAAAIRARACRLGFTASCLGGARPDRGPYVTFDRVDYFPDHRYEPLPMIEALEVALAPCAQGADADGVSLDVEFKVSSDGAVESSAEVPDGSIQRCWGSHVLQTAPPEARPRPSTGTAARKAVAVWKATLRFVHPKATPPTSPKAK